MAVFTVEGARREGYDPLREPVSSLALGRWGWVQRANFVATGLLMLACAVGLRRVPDEHPAASRWGPRLVALYAIGLLGAGIFVTDPVGFGAADPGVPSRPSQRGILHGLFSLQVFASLGAAALVYAWRFAKSGERRWAVGSACSGIAVPTGIAVFGRALARDDGPGRIAGLIQRLTIVTGWSWLSGLAWFALRPRHADLTAPAIRPRLRQR